MTKVSVRDLLGIVYCPTCEQDTMPSDRTGQCFFCDRQLVARTAVRLARLEGEEGVCDQAA